MVDFQGVCLKRALRQEKSAGGHFRGVCSPSSPCKINHYFILDHSHSISDDLESHQSYRNVGNPLICMRRMFIRLYRILVRDILVWPQWTIEAKKPTPPNQNGTITKSYSKTHVLESLSNILLTYIDFRRPTLDYRRQNNTKQDETIELVPQSCIEEFDLYVSTWKGWQGPLPSKDNSITWEQVEQENSASGTISCTHVTKEPIVDLDDPYGNNSNNTNWTTTIPTPPPLPTAESFR